MVGQSQNQGQSRNQNQNQRFGTLLQIRLLVPVERFQRRIVGKDGSGLRNIEGVNRASFGFILDHPLLSDLWP